jgi:hypothetical protein
MTRKDVKGVIESLAEIGYKEIKRAGWTDGYAEDGCGPVGVPELEYLFGWSGQWGTTLLNAASLLQRCAEP